MNLIEPQTHEDWKTILEHVTSLWEEDRSKVNVATIYPKAFDMAALLAAHDKATSFSLWLSSTLEKWIHMEGQIKLLTMPLETEYEVALDTSRTDEVKVSRMVTSNKSWNERESAYRMNNGTLYRMNETAKQVLEIVKLATMSIRQQERAIRNLRDDLDLRVRMMTLQARLSGSPVYD